MSAEKVYDHALTTVARVKARLSITESGFDTILLRLINSVTDDIERRCNGRRFLETTHTNEKYSYDHPTRYLMTRHAPVSAVSSIEYRMGFPTNPDWTAFDADWYEIENDGVNGLIRIYGDVPTGTNAVRITYTAGYKIDWANFGDTTHTLPADITDLAERMVIKKFKKRDHEGKSTESFGQGSTTWEDTITEEDKELLGQYRLIRLF